MRRPILPLRRRQMHRQLRPPKLMLRRPLMPIPAPLQTSKQLMLLLQRILRKQQPMMTLPHPVATKRVPQLLS
jgi:hypothetical protein